MLSTFYSAVITVGFICSTSIWNSRTCQMNHEKKFEIHSVKTVQVMFSDSEEYWCKLPVKLFLGDFLQMIEVADKVVPAFFLLPLFSFWLCRLHFLIDTPLHMVLRRKKIKNNNWRRSGDLFHNRCTVLSPYDKSCLLQNM